jgi:hypothetical protein
MQRAWLRRITERPYVKGTILTKRVGGTLAMAQDAPALFLANLAEVVGYQLKGTSLADAEQLGLSRKAQHGKIIGKRAGHSENLGPAARTRGGCTG